MSLFTVKREVFTHHLFEGEEYSRREAWLWMISEASYAGDLKKRINGKTVILPRGTLSHSVRFMAEKWGWHRCKVERFLKMLVSDGMIKTETARKTGQTLITLCNYEEHTPTPKDRETKTETAARQQRDNITEDIGYINTTPPNAREAKNVVAVIRHFDDAIAEVYGEEKRRPWPHQTDRTHAENFLKLGADLSWLRDFFRLRIHHKHESGQPPPVNLAWLRDAVPQALKEIEAAKNYQPKENERATHGKPKQRHSGFERQDYRAGTEGFDVLD